MKTWIAAFSLVLLISAVGTSRLMRADAADEVACIKCHTDADVMKSLFKAPKVEPGEGEG